MNCYYSSGAIFIDLKESENRSGQIVKELHKGHQVFGFRGGMVLRYERDDSCTGQVSFFKNDKTDSTSNGQIIPLAKRIDELNIYQTEDGSVKIAENGGGVTLVKTSATNWSVSKLYSVNYNEEGVSLALSWSRSNFSNFCVDFLSALEGSAYNDQNRPSFGMIFDRLRLELAPLQPSQPRPEYPYLTISLHAGGSNGGKIIVSNEDDADTFEFWVEVENEGEVEALISHDMFQHSIILPVKEKTKTPIKYVSMRDDKSRSLQDILASEGLEFPFRLVYKVSLEGKEELYAVERTVKILGSNISLL